MQDMLKRRQHRSHAGCLVATSFTATLQETTQPKQVLLKSHYIMYRMPPFLFLPCNARLMLLSLAHSTM